MRRFIAYGAIGCCFDRCLQSTRRYISMTVSELIRTKRAVRQFTFGNYSLRDDMMSLGKNTFLLIFEGRVIVFTGGFRAPSSDPPPPTSLHPSQLLSHAPPLSPHTHTPQPNPYFPPCPHPHPLPLHPP